MKKPKNTLKEYIVSIIKEFSDDDKIIRYWALYAHFIEKGFGKIESQRALNQLYDTLYNNPKRSEDEKGAIEYFYNFRKRELGLPYEKEKLVGKKQKIEL